MAEPVVAGRTSASPAVGSPVTLNAFPPEAAARRTPRLPALDGLRGVAALIVLVFHVLILSPALAEPAPGVRVHEPSWWLTHTPLYLLWAGPEAVLLFFVLSGFVLALPGTVGPVGWRAYYPARLIRLYVPVWGSLLLAAAFAAVVPRVSRPALSDWYAAHVSDVAAAEVARDAVLLFGTGWLNSALWSLRWEMWFSLLLPVYLVLVAWQRRWWLVKLLGGLSLVVLGQHYWRPEVLYLSMFGFGVLMAFERERLAAAANRVRGAAPGWLLAAAAVLLLTAPAALLALGLEHPAVRAGAIPTQLLGACLTVALALHWEPLRRWLNAGWVQWLGVRSFSVYLVHEPIVVSSGALWPERPVLVHLMIVVPVGLIVAAAFYRLVERPAQRLSRRAARSLA